MVLPVTFGSLPPGNTPASTLDEDFAAVGQIGIVPCTAIGSNSITLTPLLNTPLIANYIDQQLFGFLAVASGTGTQIQVNSLPFLPLFFADGATFATTEPGHYYLVVYRADLQSGFGGFEMLANGAISGGTNLVLTGDVIGTGSSTIVTLINTLSHSISMGGFKITNLGDPFAANDAVNLEYLSAYVAAHAVLNLGGAPNLQEGLSSAQPAPGHVGNLYIASDLKTIYRDNGIGWDILSNSAAVASVGLTSTDLAISGSPVTGTGTIVANLATQGGLSAGTYASVTVNTKGVVTSATNPAYSGQVYVESPTNKTYIALGYAATAMTVLSVFAQTSSGTVTIAAKINGVTIGGLSSVAVSSVGAVTNATSANVMATGDQLTITTSATASAADLDVTFLVQ